MSEDDLDDEWAKTDRALAAAQAETKRLQKALEKEQADHAASRGRERYHLATIRGNGVRQAEAIAAFEAEAQCLQEKRDAIAEERSHYEAEVGRLREVLEEATKALEPMAAINAVFRGAPGVPNSALWRGAIAEERSAQITHGDLRRATAALASSAPQPGQELRERVASLIALAGLGTTDGRASREPPNDGWMQEDWERRILECIPGAVEDRCYALADAILTLSVPPQPPPGRVREALEAIKSYSGAENYPVDVAQAKTLLDVIQIEVSDALSALGAAG